MIVRTVVGTAVGPSGGRWIKGSLIGAAVGGAYVLAHQATGRQLSGGDFRVDLMIFAPVQGLTGPPSAPA